MHTTPQKQSGVTLIEVLVAISVIAVMIVVVGYSVVTYVDARSQLVSDMKSLYLAEEGYEMLRFLRDEDWTTIAGLTVGDTYSFDVSTTTIGITSTIEVVDGGYYRSFVVEAVERDGNGDIDFAGGGTTDDNTRLITISVFGPTGTTSLSAVLANIYAI
jgi:prepilin-type N-terminal cleavage/methylation domain-containing protein